MYKHYRHLCFLFALLMILMSICGFLVIGIGNDALALRWVLVNIAISAVVLLAVNLLERRR